MAIISTDSVLDTVKQKGIDLNDIKPQTGLINKFHVERLIPSSRGIDHSGCEYFTLDPKHDPIARGVLVEYARIADQIGEKQLASDIFLWLSELAAEDLLRSDDESHPQLGI